MSLLNFSDTSQQAFIRGFWKGVAAPVMLFGNFDLPKRREIKPVTIEYKSDADALASDWKKIGADFHKVIVIHGKETHYPK